MGYGKNIENVQIEYLESGHTYRKTAEVFGLSTNTLAKWVKVLREMGDLKDSKR